MHLPGMMQPAPPAAYGLSWGAFFLTPFWAIANQVWIGLLWFLFWVPYIGLLIQFGIMFYLLFKGSELAWRSGRYWRSTDEFAQVQGAWNSWGIGLFVVNVVLLFGLFLLAMIVAGAAR